MGEVLVENHDVIVTRTPLRISFAGGGTDLPAFYERERGAVFSATIDRYVYVTVKRHSELFFEPIRLNYSHSEQVETLDEIENNIARECLRFLEIEPPIYISTVGDVPASTGLGGSSAFCVGLLNALHVYRGERVPAGQLAEEACHIEIDVLGQPIGKQDQYAAAFGGLNFISFKPDGRVTLEHARIRRGMFRDLERHLLMFWTGHQRSASAVLKEQSEKAGDHTAAMRKMRDLAEHLYLQLEYDRFEIRELGEVLDTGWQLKRELASGITNPEIDQRYAAGRAAGAWGGKLCGAGGGGFLLFVAPPEAHASIRSALGDLAELRVRLEPNGSHATAPFPT